TIPNSEVKRTRANDSVGLPHVKVGHRQGFFPKAAKEPLFFFKKFYLFYLSCLPVAHF
ncbi:hypothetical protein Loak_1277, partial [Legionella oakridgensis]